MKTFSAIMLALAKLLVSIGLLGGCERREIIEEPPMIQKVEYDAIMVVLKDMSPSYREHLDRAFHYFVGASDSFFRERLGVSNDRMVIGQVSGGVTKTLLFDGSPRAFRKEFSGAASFKRFLSLKSDNYGSRCWGGVADSLEYVLAQPGVREKRTRVAALLFCDFDDNDPKGPQEKQRLAKVLAECGQVNFCLGAYWVDRRIVVECEKMLAASGIKNYVIHADIRVDPPALRFE